MRILASLFALSLILAVLGLGAAFLVFREYSKDLPGFEQLASYDPPTVTRVHAGDGRILAEYAIEKRVFVPIQVIPKRVINAFLAAEDKNFYHHKGVDIVAVGRAVMTNVAHVIQGRRPVGASTVTQQVAKNFLLTNELKIERKVREAILALRIEKAFSKDRILELYLNEIYLGLGSYGVAAASLNYFNKSLDELSIAEAAYLAALPKAPNNYHPVRHHEAALARRDWVIGRIVEEGWITAEQAEEALIEPLEVQERGDTEVVEAEYFAEEVRRDLVELYGEDKVYQGGLSVRTTLAPRLQKIADKALRDGLIAYDRNHGWRGPIGQSPLDEESWAEELAKVARPPAPDSWRLAVVRGLDKTGAEIGLSDGTAGWIPMAELTWARPTLKGQLVGNVPKTPAQVLAKGDVVLVESVLADGEGEAYPEGSYGLRQIPDINGGIVALDPHTGRVLAMTGGWDFAQSEFNRSTQAYRQPGSAFKPIVYLTALDNGFTPATIILDAPFVIDQGEGKGKWKPANYTNTFYGPTPMRIGIEKSRNLMTVRLAWEVGMSKIVDYAERLGVIDDMRPELAMALGAGETTLLRLTTAYAMLVNGGRRITPSLIDRVQDSLGNTVYRHDQRACQDCTVETWAGNVPPQLPDEREQVADPRSVYQVVSMMEGVVTRGTGRRIRAVGKPLAGKTGTTNEAMDTWFVGFTPDLAVGVFVGFDSPKPLGPKQTGSNVAAPIFKDFMAAALEDQPAIPFRIPPGIRLVRMNLDNGRLARAGDKNVIREAFKEGTLPGGKQRFIDGGYNPGGGTAAATIPGGDGLY
jgi:penicillin-binding protein 1A